jgi:hypothetical protein
MLRQPTENQMTSLFDLKQNELEKLSLEVYFKTIAFAIDKGLSVDRLTNFFSIDPYTETKPYLTRRQLIPTDKRFKRIELVYNDNNKVDAIVWDIQILLSQLTDVFGEPIIDNEPYSDTTAFAFKTDNQNIEIIKTRHPNWLTKMKGKNVFEYQNKDNQKVELVDPEFSFVQFDLTKLKE